MPDSTNYNPQTPNLDPIYNPQQGVQPTAPVNDFSAPSQDFSYYDPTQVAEPIGQAPEVNYYNTGDYGNTGPQAPLQDFTSQVDPYQSPLDPSLQPGADLNSGLDNIAPLAVANTFSERKTGNKKLLFVAIGAVTLLLIAAGTLVYLNLSKKDTAQTATTATTTPKPIIASPVVDTPTKPAVAVTDNTMSGGNDTPASKSRVHTDNPPKDWFKKSFVSPAIDSEGTCLVLETCGLDSDKDKDGLTTLQEYQFGSDPLNEDTDADGIADGDEVFVYYSSPTKKDSDLDTYKDNEEIVSCFDPNLNSPDTISNSRLATIGNNVSLKTLHEPTIKTLKAAGATQSDLNSKGTVSIKCTKPGTDSAPAASSSVQNAPQTAITSN